MKKTLIAVIAAITALPAVAGAQGPGQVDPPRVDVRVVVQQTQQERIREQQVRERERAQERASQHRREFREEQTEKISRTLKIGGSGELELANLSGDITITRGGGNAVQVEATKIARGRTVQEAREMLALVTLDVVERGTRAEVRARYPRHEPGAQGRRNVNVSVRYVVTAPEHTRISVHSLSGTISITDIKGDLNLMSTSGDVAVTNGARLMSARSTSGSVQIDNLQSEIGADVNSISGDITIRKSRVPRVQMGTISGTLEITDVQCERLEAQTLSGDIAFTSPLAKNGRYELNSHTGTIRIAPTGNTGFELDANSFNGDIRSELTLTDQRQGGADFPRRGRGGRTRSLNGTFGDGSAMLDITTFSGSVLIVKR